MPRFLERGRVPPPHYHICQPGATTPIYVQMLGLKDDAWTGQFHFIGGDVNKLAPCLKERCRWCPLPRRWQGFAPVLLYIPLPVEQRRLGDTRKPTDSWKPHTLRITKGMSSILFEDLRNKVVEVKRRKPFKNGPCVWTVMEQLPAAALIDFPPFDVYDSVDNEFGVYGWWEAGQELGGGDHPHLAKMPESEAS
jgi:hypothetical protein